MSEDHLSLDVEKALEAVDEYTIGIVGILGITYTGQYDDIKKLDQLVEEYNQQTQHKVYIHVDAASGGLYQHFRTQIRPGLSWRWLDRLAR